MILTTEKLKFLHRLLTDFPDNPENLHLVLGCILEHLIAQSEAQS